MTTDTTLDTKTETTEVVRCSYIEPLPITIPARIVRRPISDSNIDVDAFKELLDKIPVPTENKIMCPKLCIEDDLMPMNYIDNPSYYIGRKATHE